ncbi:DUF1659 domain-containing protein [Tepidibacter formicigenes]|jgi:hypothetical protein|uniref:Uncharacterized protein n=1 Tax=Tepidibacter formicigenes DSM 15518 TaxID=1123349 RepID=A0A1M6N684_9FIRM|nr:DUF1659 domain-containing protein [Tepidibacter formicigenes]SHJ91200.1 hypothetical protein SAMN02744037_01176 [Tepidibacter formicigenes DSM 15518]
MAVAIPVSTSVRISYEVGEEKKNEIINNVKDTALDDYVYECKRI